MKRLPRCLAWALLMLAVLAGCGPGQGSSGVAGARSAGAGGGASGYGPAANPPANAARAGDVRVSERADGRGFRSRERLAEHFARHGREFGDISVGEYLDRARRLRDAPAGGLVLELRRPGGFARFDRATGAFGAYDDDGTIRTFFKPNDGEAYFRRQARRHGG